MESWFGMVVRQLILYSLPVVVSLSIVHMAESRLLRKQDPEVFRAIGWRGTWMPLLASLAFQRGIIIALPNPVERSLKAALLRCGTHALLCLLGLILFIWSMAYQTPVGQPALHYWWTKVLMFFNLCMTCLHLLPFSGLAAGQLLARTRPGGLIASYIHEGHAVILVCLLAASPLLDIVLGNLLVFPVYESINNLAARLSGSR